MSTTTIEPGVNSPVPVCGIGASAGGIEALQEFFNAVAPDLGLAYETIAPINSNFAPVGFYTSQVHNYNVPNGVETANKLLDDAGFKRGAGGIRFEIVHDLTPYSRCWPSSASRPRCATRTWPRG